MTEQRKREESWRVSSLLRLCPFGSSKSEVLVVSPMQVLYTRKLICYSAIQGNSSRLPAMFRLGFKTQDDNFSLKLGYPDESTGHYEK